jgi:hypothetical protein
MGLALRLTFQQRDYVFEVESASALGKATTDLNLIFNGDKVSLIKDKNGILKQETGHTVLEPELTNALGRSISLRFRI